MKTTHTQFGKPMGLWLTLSIPLFVSCVQAQQTEPTAAEFEMPVPIRSAEDVALQTAFTFVRIEYSGHPDRARGGWTSDYPEPDRALSSHFRLES